MISEVYIAPPPTPRFRRFLNGLISAVVAWLALVLIAAIYAFVMSLIQHSGDFMQLPWWIVPAMMSVYATAFVFSTWITVLLPVHFFAQQNSPLRRWPIYTLLGVLSGAGVMICFLGIRYSLSVTSMLFVASFCGAITCLIDARLWNRPSREFQRMKKPNKP